MPTLGHTPEWVPWTPEARLSSVGSATPGIERCSQGLEAERGHLLKVTHLTGTRLQAPRPQHLSTWAPLAQHYLASGPTPGPLTVGTGWVTWLGLGDKNGPLGSQGRCKPVTPGVECVRNCS